MEDVIAMIGEEIDWADNQTPPRSVSFALVIPYEKGKPAWRAVDMLRKTYGPDAARTVVVIPAGTMTFEAPDAWSAAHMPAPGPDGDDTVRRAKRRPPRREYGDHTKRTRPARPSAAKFAVGIIDCSSSAARAARDAARYTLENLAALREWADTRCTAAPTLGCVWRQHDVPAADALRTPPWCLHFHGFPWGADWAPPPTAVAPLPAPDTAMQRLLATPPLWWQTVCVPRALQTLPLTLGVSPPSWRTAVCTGLARLWEAVEAKCGVPDTRTDAERRARRDARSRTAYAEIARALRCPLGAPARAPPPPPEDTADDNNDPPE